MNAIQQISLKLQLGIDPAATLSPGALRALWQSHARKHLPHRCAPAIDAIRIPLRPESNR